jgi:hypothetical protein
VFATGELETVYNVRVSDHHTYFVGDDGWGWAAWAHNVYKWTKPLTGKFSGTYQTGEYNRVTGRGYDEIWWKPASLPTANASVGMLQASPCRDKPYQPNGWAKGLGDLLEDSAQAFVNAWPAQPLNERYGSYQQACQTALNSSRQRRKSGYFPGDLLYTSVWTRKCVRVSNQSNVRSSRSSIVRHRWFRVTASCSRHQTRSIGFVSGAYVGR